MFDVTYNYLQKMLCESCNPQVARKILLQSFFASIFGEIRTSLRQITQESRKQQQIILQPLPLAIHHYIIPSRILMGLDNHIMSTWDDHFIEINNWFQRTYFTCFFYSKETANPIIKLNINSKGIINGF